jgi:hypothetical protein
MSIYNLLADIVVVIHAAYATFVVLGLLAILFGYLLRWNWVRNFWFRAAHLLAISIVVFQQLFNVDCPLTTLEKHFTVKAGLEPYPRSFVGECVHNLLIYDAPRWVFTILYCFFGAVVLATFFLVPPRWPRWKRKAEPDSSSAQDSSS